MAKEQSKAEQPQQNAVAEAKKPTAVDIFKGQLYRYETDLKALLAMHNITPEKFMTTTLNAVKKAPKLLECDQKTLFGAILVSAELGLPPNTPMGYSHIIPYNRKFKEDGRWQSVLEAQFQIGYPGWLEIMYRNPKIESIESGVIYENEEWFFDKGKREPFSHNPLTPAERGEKWVAVFAIAWIKEVSRPKVVVLYREDVDKIKKLSQGATSDHSPWNSSDKDPFLWMPRKTALKQLAKELPKTNELERIYNIDTATETGGTVRLNDEEGNVEVVETTYMQDLNKQEKMEAKAGAVADSVKKLMPTPENPAVDKTGQTNLI